MRPTPSTKHPYTRHRRLIVLALVASALVVPALALPALAQPEGPTAEPSTPARKARADRAPKAKRLAKMRRRLLRQRVGLSETKASQVEAIVRGGSAERRRARQQLAEARQEMRALFASDSDDQRAWAAALAKLKGARDRMQSLREAQYLALSKSLTPKEQAKLLRAMHRVSRHLRDRRGNVKDPFDKAQKRRPKPKPAPPKPRPGKLKDPFARP